jgi:outer membrane protein assembly factor BamD (BamD/ComL family)
MNKRSKIGQWAVAGALALVMATMPAWAVDVVHLTNGKSIQAKDIQWREGEQTYRVTTPDDVMMPIPKAQVESLEIAKPAAFAQAETMMAGKQYAAAIPLLDDVVGKYKMKVWDNEARKFLAQAHMAMNEPKKAADVLEGFMSSVPKAESPADAIMLYWKALLAAGRGATLKKELDEVAASGTRSMAAAAMLMRGNMNREAGQKEPAVLDYLRVVILFENIKAVQPEALFKAAEILEEMRDPRADEMKKKLVQEYKDSEYAAKLSGKI